MRLTNNMITILTNKILEELKKGIDVSKEYNKSTIKKAFDKLEKYDKEIANLNKLKSEVGDKLIKLYNVNPRWNSNFDTFTHSVEINIINKKLPSHSEIETEILLSGNLDLAELVERLVNKYK